jgi:hypothetical protein
MILMLFAVMLTGCSQQAWDDFWQAILNRLSPDEEPVNAPAEEPPPSPAGVAALGIPPSSASMPTVG